MWLAYSQRQEICSVLKSCHISDSNLVIMAIFMYRTILARKLTKPFVHILFGARQTGKSTLLRSLVPENTVILGLSDPRERVRFAARPGLLVDICRSFPRRSLENRLVFGDLPGVALLEDNQDRADLLTSYATAYLEEEVRREASIRDWGHFLRFLKFSAGESGGIVNLTGVSKETGISAPTIKGYYQLLEDMFIGFSIPAFSGSSRKSVLSSPRFFYFDLGVRNAAAGIPLVEGTVNAIAGSLFEQWVGIQLWRKLSYSSAGRLSYYRTTDGAEVDFIIEKGDEIIPVEVKWTEYPSLKDARHLDRFITEHHDRCTRGYLVSRCPYRLALNHRITAIPYWEV